MYLILLIAGAVLLIAAGSKTVGPAAPPPGKIGPGTGSGIKAYGQAGVNYSTPPEQRAHPVQQAVERKSGIRQIFPDTGDVLDVGGASVTMQRISKADNIDRDTQAGGLDLSFDVPDFWRVVIRLRPRNWMEHILPGRNVTQVTVNSIPDSAKNNAKYMRTKGYTVGKLPVAGGTWQRCADDEEGEAPRWHEQRLTHFNYTDLSDYMDEYRRWVKWLNPSGSQLFHIISPDLGRPMRVADYFLRELYLESINDWVVFSRGTDPNIYGNTNHDSYHSFVVANYYPYGESDFGSKIVMGWMGKRADDMGQAWANWAMSVVSVVGGALGKLDASGAFEPLKKTLSKYFAGITHEALQVYERFKLSITDFYEKFKNEFPQFAQAVENYNVQERIETFVKRAAGDIIIGEMDWEAGLRHGLGHFFNDSAGHGQGMEAKFYEPVITTMTRSV